MNYERICYGCFRERPSAEGICPYCGYGPHVEHPANTLPPGTILAGRYLTGRVLGVGGFGVTYLAFDMKLEEKCACKEYLPSGMAVRTRDRYTLSVARSESRAAYESGMEKFLNEARILARLKNVPNIVSVRDFFSENGTAYFVMQYIEGQSLKELLKSRGGKLSYEETSRILLPIMRALRQVHARQLLHRDISPDNIYLTNRGVPVLLDFGAARSSAGDGTTMSVILKHGYAPVEQYSAHGNQGPWTDVYALGATMYHCLTGQLPPNAVDRLRDDNLIPPSALGAELPAAAENALLTALAVRAEDRFVSMQAFADAMQGGTSEAAPASPGTHRTQQPPAGGSTAGVPATAARSHQKEPASFLQRLPLPLPVLIGIAAGVLALIIILVAVRAKKNDSVADPEPPVTASQSVTPTAEPTPEPEPTPASTIDDGEYLVYDDANTGLTFRYLPDDAVITTSEATAEGSYWPVYFDYDDVSIMVGRLGALGTTPESFLMTIAESPGETMSVVGDAIREGDMGSLHYYYTIMQENGGDALAVYYVTEMDGELVMIVETLLTGEQTQEQANQFGLIASTVELL